MESVWKEEFQIKTYEVDFSNRLKISSFFNYMQELAGRHAENIGVGYDQLDSKGLLWVLSRVKISIENTPCFGDKLKIETWPKTINRLFAVRDFNFTNDAGQRIGSATTYWLLLDSKSMKPQKIESLGIALPRSEDKHGLNEALDKINPSGSEDLAYEKVVRYNDIDINKHVNNEKYVEWILDCFSCDTFVNKEIRTLQVNYIAEAKFNDSIVINKIIDANDRSCFYIEGINSVSQNKVFQSKIEWI